jgi:hypothetical protein
VVYDISGCMETEFVIGNLAYKPALNPVHYYHLRYSVKIWKVKTTLNPKAAVLDFISWAFDALNAHVSKKVANVSCFVFFIFYFFILDSIVTQISIT